MTEACRVLVVDDSAVARRIVTAGVKAIEGCEVMATAVNGNDALEKIAQKRPDVVTLDVEMPDLDGIETVRAIRKKYPELPVIMLSSVTTSGAKATIDALVAGADDYIAKPTSVANIGAAIETLRDGLGPKLRAVTSRRRRRRKVASVRELPKPAVRRAIASSRASGKAPELLAIGSSTGGPAALATLFEALPPSMSAPIVVAQHMPPKFTALLAERLSTLTHYEVREGLDGAELKPGEAWIAPGGFHMILERSKNGLMLSLHEGPAVHHCRPAVDVLFESVASAAGQECLAVVLTGLGMDGVEGTRAIVAAGGSAIVQDKSTSVVWGMPGHVAKAGLAQAQVPIEQMAEEISSRFGDPVISQLAEG